MPNSIIWQLPVNNCIFCQLELKFTLLSLGWGREARADLNLSHINNIPAYAVVAKQNITGNTLMCQLLDIWIYVFMEQSFDRSFFFVFICTSVSYAF